MEKLTCFCAFLHLELLMSFCPLVERLGFDENFMDITEMVERRMEQTPESAPYSYEGHVYNLDSE
jgi:DNA polymerase iota